MAENLLEQDILESIAEEVDSLTEDELRAEMQKHMADETKRKVRQQEYNASPEVAARRKAYYEATKDKRVAYRQKRAARQKLILQKAKDAGIFEQVEAEVAAEFEAEDQAI